MSTRNKGESESGGIYLVLRGTTKRRALHRLGSGAKERKKKVPEYGVSVHHHLILFCMPRRWVDG